MKKNKISSIIITLLLNLAIIITPFDVLSVKVEAVAALDAPTDITYSRTNEGISVKWNKVSGAYAYRVYIKKDYNLDLESDDGWEKYKTVKSNSCLIKMDKKEVGIFVGINIISLKKEGNKYLEGNKIDAIGIKWVTTEEYPRFIGPENYGFKLIRTGDKRKKETGDVLVWKCNKRAEYRSTASLFISDTTDNIGEWTKSLVQQGYYIEEKDEKTKSDNYRGTSNTKLEYYFCYGEEKLGVLSFEEDIGHTDQYNQYSSDYFVTYTIKIDLYNGYDMKRPKKKGGAYTISQ